MKILLWLIFAVVFSSSQNTLTYDERSFYLNGKRTIFLSGSIHYPRSTPEKWDTLMKEAKRNGLNMIQTYVFWNLHEQEEGKYDFETGRLNLNKFLEAAKANDLWIHLRIGPYVCGEWDLGGIPGWLRNKAGIDIRNDNPVWKNYMERFTKKVLRVVDSHLGKNGGNIIMAQIENEYGDVERGHDGHVAYIKWCADMATTAEPSLVWVMCKQEDAPLSVVKACNGFTCHDWMEQHQNDKQPGMYTENWPGWFTAWGEPRLHRPVEDVAYSVLRWFASGGSFMNYYMFHGGTNFERTGARHYVTAYDYDTVLNEYGQPYARKFNHLQKMHNVLWSMQDVFFGTIQKSGIENGAFAYAAGEIVFLVNENNFTQSVAWKFGDKSSQYTLKGRSVVIANKSEVIFNSTDVGVPWDPETKYNYQQCDSCFQFDAYRNPVSYFKESRGVDQTRDVINANDALDQMVFNDTSDYLWYEIFIGKTPDRTAKTWCITFDKIVDWQVPFRVFSGDDLKEIKKTKECTGQDKAGKWYKGYAIDTATLSKDVNITILSMMRGTDNYGIKFFDTIRGMHGCQVLMCFDVDNCVYDDVSILQWSHQNALLGESTQIYNREDHSIQWSPFNPSMDLPFTWFKLQFTYQVGAGQSEYPVVVNLTRGFPGWGMCWMNGHGLGRFSSVVSETTVACQKCDWQNGYNPSKMCGTGCGEITQQLYHIPYGWLQKSNNLICFSEDGGNPKQLMQPGTFLLVAPPKSHHLNEKMTS